MRCRVGVAMTTRLLTIREISEELFGGYNKSLRQRTYNFLEANEVPLLKDGKQFYVTRAALEQLLGEAQ